MLGNWFYKKYKSTFPIFLIEGSLGLSSYPAAKLRERGPVFLDDYILKIYLFPGPWQRHFWVLKLTRSLFSLFKRFRYDSSRQRPNSAPPCPVCPLRFPDHRTQFSHNVLCCLHVILLHTTGSWFPDLWFGFQFSNALFIFFDSPNPNFPPIVNTYICTTCYGPHSNTLVDLHNEHYAWVMRTPAGRVCVLCLQWTNSHGLQKSYGEKGWHSRSRSEREGPTNPCLDRLLLLLWVHYIEDGSHLLCTGSL